jgi:hypothetical protein
MSRGGGKQLEYRAVGCHGEEVVFKLAISLGRRSSVFDAETFASAHSCKRAPTYLNSHTSITFLSFSSGSASALSAIQSPSAHSNQICFLSFSTNCLGILLKPFHFPRLVVGPCGGHRK